MTVDAEPWTLLSIGVSFIILRLYARWRHVGLRNLEADDYLMVLFAVGFAADVALAYSVGAYFNGLTNGYMTDDERRTLDPNSLEYYNRQWGSKIQVIGWSLYVFCLWTVKMTFVVFFSRLTSGLPHMRIRIYIGYGLIVVTYIFVALGLLFSCQPMHHFWQIYPDPGPLCQAANSPFYVYAVLISDVVTDIYLVSIPLPLLLRAKIPIGQKIYVTTLFCGSFVVIAAAIARGVAIRTAGLDGAISGSKWACRETFVAALVGNLPASQSLFRPWATKVGRLLGFSQVSEEPSHRLESVDRDQGGKGVSFANHTATAWASEEHNIGDQRSAQSSSHSGGDFNKIAVTHEFVVHSQQN